MRTISAYKTYNFVDKDPVIDVVRTAIASAKINYLEIQERSGVSKGTLMHWMHGRTKRPKYATVVAVMKALGYDIHWKRTAVIAPIRKRKAA